MPISSKLRCNYIRSKNIFQFLSLNLKIFKPLRDLRISWLDLIKLNYVQISITVELNLLTVYARNTLHLNKITNEAAEHDVFEDTFQMIGSICVCVKLDFSFEYSIQLQFFRLDFVFFWYFCTHPPSFRLQKNCDLSNMFH